MNLQDAEKLAWTLLEQFKLKQKGWKFKFDNAKPRYGKKTYVS